jgi:large subunit ribosomal protein L32
VPVPKRKQSRSNTRARKANWKSAISAPTYAECPQCHQPKRPHAVCLNCGYYDGREVLEVE